MASYGVVRPLARAVFSFEAQYMLWGMAATPLLVTLIIWPYGKALSYLGPRKTVLWCTSLSALLLALPLLIRHPYLTFFLYVWKDVYVVLLVEQFWSLANSMHTVAAGKRRFGVLLFIGGLGAVFGNLLVALLSEPLGAWTVYQGAILFLLPFAFFISRAHHALGAPEPARGTSEKPVGAGFDLLSRSPYLLTIAAIVALGQVMAGALEVVFTQHVEEVYGIAGGAAHAQDARAAFEGRFWTWVNLGSMSMQLVTPLLLGILAIPVVHLLIPFTHLVAIGVLLVYPSLPTAAFAFAWFKVVDYSLFRASKEVLYVPLDFHARYRAKMIIDMTIYRTAKGGSGLILYLLGTLAATFGRLLTVAALGSAALWALFAWKIRDGFAKLDK
jgi:ATP/ADP translocase